MKKTILVFLFTLGSFGILEACLNYYYTADRYGNLHKRGTDDEILQGFNTNFNRQRIVSKIGPLGTKLRAERSFMLLSDYALMLMKLGKNDAALKILRALYLAHPGEYQLASNLGTSYELAGNVDSALKYIHRGIELNPQDHEGSEWIHLRILETKQKLAEAPHWLNDHTVLQLTDAQYADTIVRNQIEIQVRERFPFCPGPDAIMSSLMIDLAEITFNTQSIEDARCYLQIAQNYYGDSSRRVTDKLVEVNKALSRNINVRPEQSVPGHREASNLRIGGYQYTRMLNDNDDPAYVIDWTALETNPDTLLALVGLKLPAEAVQELPKENMVVSETKTASGKIPKDKTGLWICLSIFLIFGITYGIALRRNG